MGKATKKNLAVAKRRDDQMYRDKNRGNEEWRQKQCQKAKRHWDKKKATSSERAKALQRRHACERKRLQREREKIKVRLFKIVYILILVDCISVLPIY
jgi:hypothetical protein